MNTHAPTQKRQHDDITPYVRGTGRQGPVAGVGLPLFMQAKSKASVAGATLQRQCACANTSSANDACETCNSGKPLQAKLSIGASDDPLEQEADQVAEQVLAAPAAVGGAPLRIQRFTGSPCGATGTAPDSVDRVLAGSGRPLEPALQQDMGRRFGHDFSRVRVHSDGAAEQSARDVNANAYTVGHDIVFGEGRFAPETHEGQRLIAHELTHVVQQSGTSGLEILRKPDETQQGGQEPVALDTPNKAPSCDDICGEKNKCTQEPNERCSEDQDKVIVAAWTKAGTETAAAVDHLNDTPGSAAVNQSLKANFDWDGKTPADLPAKVAAVLKQALDKMSENLCVKCQPCATKGNSAQVVQARGVNCLDHR